MSWRSSRRALPEPQRRVMLQNLLVERFQLQSHREQLMSNVNVLTVAKGGLKLQPVAAAESAGGLRKRAALS